MKYTELFIGSYIHAVPMCVYIPYICNFEHIMSNFYHNILNTKFFAILLLSSCHRVCQCRQNDF